MADCVFVLVLFVCVVYVVLVFALRTLREMAFTQTSVLALSASGTSTPTATASSSSTTASSTSSSSAATTSYSDLRSPEVLKMKHAHVSNFRATVQEPFWSMTGFGGRARGFRAFLYAPPAEKVGCFCFFVVVACLMQKLGLENRFLRPMSVMSVRVGCVLSR